ncbi:hypothetical protein TNCV_5128601 [Trichonephila clavipes]|nr:hypothetical protein TNCV_5128601 [Trichonephila clavipes]
MSILLYKLPRLTVELLTSIESRHVKLMLLYNFILIGIGAVDQFLYVHYRRFGYTIGYNFQSPPDFGLRCPVLLRPIAALSKSIRRVSKSS